MKTTDILEITEVNYVFQTTLDAASKQIKPMITETLTTRNKILFSILTIFLSLVFSLLIAEFGLRLIYREVEVNGNYWGIGAFIHHDLTGYVHAPGYEGYAFRSKAFNSHVKINPLSLRQGDLEHQLQYPAKLLILGDSFTFGLGVAEEQSFPSIMKNELNALDVGIINGAQAGYSVVQEMLFGISLISQLKPDIVVLGLFSANDIESDYYKRYLNIEVKFGYRLRKDRRMKIKSVDFLRTHSYLWMAVESKLKRQLRRKIDAQFRTVAKTQLQEVVQPTLDAIVKLRNYCESENIVFGIVMIPTKPGKTIFDESIKVFFHDAKIDVLDLGTKGFGNQEYLPRDGHLSEKGHEKASKFLVPFVAGLLEKRQE